jgi:hypothetical protein
MKTLKFYLAVCIVPAVPAHAQTLALTDVTVIDVAHGTALARQTVVVTGDRIAAVGLNSDVPVPEDAVQIDGAGRFLIPGLWDMHVHSSTDYNQRQIFLPLYVANGVTGVRDLGGDCLEPCGPLVNPVDTLRAWARDIEAGTLVGPRMVGSSEIIGPPDPGESSSVQAPRTEEHGRALARLLAERGVDMIKVYDGVPRDAFFGLLNEGRTLGLPVVGHVPLAVPATEAAAAGMRSMEHLFGIVDECSATESVQRPAVVDARRKGDSETVFRNLFTSLENFSLERCRDVYRKLAESETWVVPTLVVHGANAADMGWRRHPGVRYLPRDELEYWMSSLAELAFGPGGLAPWTYIGHRIALITQDLHKAGVPILAGSDALAAGVFPGFGLHDELEFLVEAGLPPADALRSATLEPARYLQATDSLGTVEAGKVADLVLLDANPLEDISNTRRIGAVITRGRLFDRQALDSLLARAAEAARGPS